MTLRKEWSISLNSSIDVPRVGLSNKLISCLSTESGDPLALTASSMLHLMTTGLSFHSPLYTCKVSSNVTVRDACLCVIGEAEVIPLDISHVKKIMFLV